MKAALSVLFFVMACATARASSIPYAQVGTVAPQTALYASSGGGLDLFFYGSTAGYTDYVGVFDLKTGYNSGLLFDSKTTTPGTEAIVGAGVGQINAGDPLVVFIDSPEEVFTSASQYSADGVTTPTSRATRVAL